MNFIKRGFLGIVRRLGKSFILLAAVFILGNLISGAISIQQATGNVESVIKERLGAAATIEIDNEALDKLSEEEWMTLEIGNVSVDTIKEVGDISYVKYFDYNMTTWLGSEDLQSYQGDQGDFGGEIMIGGGMSMDFELKGINYAPVLDFEEDKAKLVDGRVFEQAEVDNGTSVAIISKKLAEQNNLHVGDNFTLDNSIYDYSDTGEEEVIDSRDVVLEIIGLFEPQLSTDEMDDGEGDGLGGGMDFDFMAMDAQNRIYVPNQVVSAEEMFHWEAYAQIDEGMAEMLEEGTEAFEYYTPMYILNNAEDSEAFEEEAIPLLPELYTIISATDQYDNISGPIETMSNLAKYVLIAAIFATVLITGLVVLLFLRDRKHELGIYLSLGERRGRVIGQILIEVMVIAVIGITISLFSGNLLAGQVSETMMQADDQDDPYGQMYYYEFQTNLTTEDVIDSYEVKLSSSYVLGFYGIGLLTILVSTIIPLIYIVRLNPKKILM